MHDEKQPLTCTFVGYTSCKPLQAGVVFECTPEGPGARKGLGVTTWSEFEDRYGESKWEHFCADCGEEFGRGGSCACERQDDEDENGEG